MIESWPFSPSEIVLALPDDSSFDVSTIVTSHTLVVVRARRGQVNQRLAGFRYASSEFVLQLDDDILIDSPSIVRLMHAIKACNSCAVAPTLYKYPSLEPWDGMPRDFRSRSKHWILGKILGAKSGALCMGTISRGGVPFAVDPTFMKDESLDVDWAPGGVLLHRRINLILDQYFLFEGRASYEDLFHSVLLRKKGVKIMIIRDSRAYHPSPLVTIESWDSLIHSLSINFHFVICFGFSKTRFVLWFFYRVFSYFVRKFLSLVIPDKPKRVG